MITADSITDEQIDLLIGEATDDEDIELLELCEITQKQIVAPQLRRMAITRIAEILNAREGDTFQRTTKAIDDVIADTRAAIEQRAKRST